MNRSHLSSSNAIATQNEQFVAQRESAKARAEALRREAIGSLFDAAIGRFITWTRRSSRSRSLPAPRPNREPNLA